MDISEETIILTANGGTNRRALNGGSDTPEPMDFEEGRRVKKPRITYDRDFLLTCCNQTTTRGFSLAALSELGCLRGTKPTVYVPPRRKEDVGKKEPDDNISLRPQSRNFSGGYLPVTQNKDVPNNDLQRMLEDNFMDSRNGPNFRFPNNKRFDFNDRNRQDPRDPRDSRGDRDRDPRLNSRLDNRDTRDNRDNRDRDGRPIREIRDFRDRGDIRERDRDFRRDPRDHRDREHEIRGNRDREWDTRGDMRQRDSRDGFRDRDRDRNFRDDRDRDMDKDKRDRDRRGRPPGAFTDRYQDEDGLKMWEESEPVSMNKWNYEQMKNGRPTIYQVDIPKFQRKHVLREIFRREVDVEPEWFTSGPASRHETMELRGFDNDERNRDPGKETAIHKSAGEESQKSESSLSSSNMKGNEKVEEGEGASAMNLNIEKILTMEHIPGLENGLEDDDDGQIGRSKFSQIFQRNSGGSTTAAATAATTDDGKGHALLDKLQHPQPAASSDANSNVETEEKKEIVEELGNALRSILLQKTGNPEKAPEREREPPKPVQPQKTEKEGPGVNALKALLDKLIESPSTSSEKSYDDEPRLSFFDPPGLDRAAQEARTEELRQMPLHELLQTSTEYQPSAAYRQRQQQLITGSAHYHGPNRPVHPHHGLVRAPHPPGQFRSQEPMIRPQQQQQGVMRPQFPQPPPQNGNIVPGGYPHPLHAIPVFENLVRPPFHPPTYHHLIPPTAMSVQQVFQMMPVEIQFLVQHVDPEEAFWTQADSPTVANAVQRGTLSFWTILEDLVSMQTNRTPFLAGIVQLVLVGRVSSPTFQMVGPPLQLQHQRNQTSGNTMVQRVLNQQQTEDVNCDGTRRSNTPVSNSSMAFCPTAVMRKMTADSPKPSNPNPQPQPQPQGPATADFNILVQQLTGQFPPNLVNPVQMVLPPNQIPQHGPRMMIPFPGQTTQSNLNLQHPRQDMPHSHS